MDSDSLLQSAPSTLHWADFVVIAVYFLFITFVGLYSSYRSKTSSVQGYFLASREMNWLLVGTSLFASNVGSDHFIGLAGSGAASGIGIATFELTAIFVLILLGWIFVPVYLASEISTMPEYLQLRFGGQRIRVYMAALALLLYIFTKISANLYAGALYIQLAMGYQGDTGLYISMMVLIIFAAIFTVAGGLTAVIWTEFVQTILMLIGAVILTILSFNKVGGYNELIRKYMTESNPSKAATLFDVHNNRSCGAVPEDAMHFFRSVVPGESDLPWTGIVFGLTISGIWYWCTDQVQVQRVLSSKTITHAKGGCIFSGYLKLLPMYLLVFPGMAARVLFTDRVACASPDVCQQICGSRTGCTNIAYPELVISIMPVGLAGLMMAVMMAALLNSLTSIFNSTSTIFSLDIWTRFRKNPSEKELLLVGRLSVIVLLAISVLWVPILKNLNASQLFIYIQQVSNFLSPPVAAVFMMAIFHSATNEPGAFWGLMIGLILGLFRFIVEFSYATPLCGTGELDLRPEWVKFFIDKIHYLHFGVILFIITLVIVYIVSAFTTPMEESRLQRLTYWTRYSIETRKVEEVERENAPAKIVKENVIEGSTQKDSKMFRKMIDNISSSCWGKAAEMTVTVEEPSVRTKSTIYETPFWTWALNINAIVLLAITLIVCFVYQ